MKIDEENHKVSITKDELEKIYNKCHEYTFDCLLKIGLWPEFDGMNNKYCISKKHIKLVYLFEPNPDDFRGRDFGLSNKKTGDCNKDALICINYLKIIDAYGFENLEDDFLRTCIKLQFIQTLLHEMCHEFFPHADYQYRDYPDLYNMMERSVEFLSMQLIMNHKQDLINDFDLTEECIDALIHVMNIDVPLNYPLDKYSHPMMMISKDAYKVQTVPPFDIAEGFY